MSVPPQYPSFSTCGGTVGVGGAEYSKGLEVLNCPPAIKSLMICTTVCDCCPLSNGTTKRGVTIIISRLPSKIAGKVKRRPRCGGANVSVFNLLVEAGMTTGCLGLVSGPVSCSGWGRSANFAGSDGDQSLPLCRGFVRREPSFEDNMLHPRSTKTKKPLCLRYTRVMYLKIWQFASLNVVR